MEPGAAAEVLSGLVEGERAWFWWCAETLPPASGFLLQPLAHDPSMTQLREEIAETPRPSGAPALSGLLQIEPGGQAALICSRGHRTDLVALANWVQAHHAAHPDLLRLRGASLRVIDTVGTVREVVADDALWQTLPAAPPPDPTAHATAILQRLGEGEQAWFWMTPQGTAGQPTLLLVPMEDDAGGERFTAQVQALRRRGARSEDAFQGVLRRQGATISLMTTVAAKDWAETVAALLGRGLRPLRSAQLVFLRDGVARKTIPLPVHRDLCETVEVLHDAAGGWFWFSAAAAAASGEPLLIARRDREALKAAAQAVGAATGTVRGRVLTAPGGAVTLQVKEPVGDDFRGVLLRWARSESRRWPALRCLRDVQIQA